MELKFEYTIDSDGEDDGDETEGSLPAVYQICSNCDGHGTHLTESIRQHGYSMEEFNESFDDEEKEHYFRRGGMYDVECTTCHGKRVEPVVDRESCERNEKLKALLAIYDKIAEDDYHYRMECEAERRMGA